MIFQKIYQIPKSRWTALPDRIINVPINNEDILNTVESLPRTPKEAGLIGVSLKRKLEYKNIHKRQLVNPKSLRGLKLHGASGRVQLDPPFKTPLQGVQSQLFFHTVNDIYIKSLDTKGFFTCFKTLDLVANQRFRFMRRFFQKSKIHKGNLTSEFFSGPPKITWGT